MKNYYLLILLMFFISCNSSKKNNKVDIKDELILYQPSELAILMEEMYTFNENVKSKIIEGKDLPDFPEKFLKIHSAEMTNTFERDSTFLFFANSFIESQNALLNSEKNNRQTNFNITVSQCIACHKTSCTGPIPRIEKLLIK